MHALTEVHETPVSRVAAAPGGSAAGWEATLGCPSLPFQTTASGRMTLLVPI
jgi:hypothetical protein